ncbi:MAG TPA: DUF695 domain-containing protein [Pyrinomonadaceae bacterium]|nr:DUF695 domain-containing protein [Pyrinomonadaceae bacterium]
MGFDSTTWAVAESEYEGHALFIKFREFPQSFMKWRYPQRLNIFWKMSDPDENELPTNEEFQRLAAFEDRLVDAVEGDEHSILLAALTCNGESEFLFHTSDVAGFLERLTNMPQEPERYPITIQHYLDPNWAYFDSVIAH